MADKKRYVAVIEFYVYAENSAEATKKANILVDSENIQHDSQCKLTELWESPIGKVGQSKKVEIS